MASLINDVLAYSQLSVPEAFQPTDLNDLVNELLLDFDEVLSRTKATVTIGELPEIDTIPARIRQVLQNLISNALKFSRSDVPPHISISAELVDSKAIDAPPSPDGAVLSHCGSGQRNRVR